MQGRLILILALTIGFLALSGATLLSAIDRIESVGAPAIPPTPVERPASRPRAMPAAAVARGSVPVQRLSPRIQRRVLRGQILLAIAQDRGAVDDCLPEDLRDFGGATLDLEVEVLDGTSRIAKVEIEDSGSAESSVLECACDALRGQLLVTPIAEATADHTHVIYPLDTRHRVQREPAALDITE